MTTDTTEMAETTVSPILMDHALKGPPQGRWTIVNWERLPDDGNRRGGVTKYVEVDPATRSLAIFQLANGAYGEPTVYREHQTLNLACLPDLPLRIAALFAGAPDTTL